MDQRNKSFPIVLIHENGTLNEAGLADFVKEEKMAEGGHFLISIMGPQSSGKSTLLNRIFETNFAVMDANITRGAITHGIWLAKSPTADNCTLVMDLEGSDGNNRGEDDTNFEKQTAVFAFALSDILLINMWSHSVGCVQAASIPLLRSIFEARRKLKIDDSKTTLWFVLRDYTEPSIDVIKNSLWKDISQAWDSVAKGTPLSNSFDVKITVLSHYVLQRQQFDREVVNLRQELLAELTTNGKKMRPSSGFSLSVQDIWKKIKEDEDLDLPSRRVMVATVRCEQIADQILSSFENTDCPDLLNDVKSGQVKNFGKSLDLILNDRLSEYDNKTEYYDEGVRTKKRTELQDTMMKMLASINSQVKTDKEMDLHNNNQDCRAKVNLGAVTAGVIGVVGAASLATVGIAAAITLGPVGVPIAVACATGFATLMTTTIHNAIQVFKPSKIKD
ncbi:hypothetical protein LguiB_009647 [Lonicera macranthoides]